MDTTEVVELLVSDLDQLVHEILALGMMRDELQRARTDLALVGRMVAQEIVEILLDELDPFGRRPVG